MKNVELEYNDHVFHKIIAETANAGLLVLTLDSKVVWANAAYLKMLKRPKEEILGNSPLEYAFSDEQKAKAGYSGKFLYDPENLEDECGVVRENMRGDGTPIWLRIYTSAYKQRVGPMLIVIVCYDVTEQVAKEEALSKASKELAYIANHDDLTGAANRSAMTAYIEKAMANTDAPNQRVGLLHLDLDNFKMINDTHGHLAGDAVLVAVVERVRNKIRKDDLVARIGGDEFVVVCCGLSGTNDLLSIAEELLKSVNQPLELQNSTVNCQVSIGATITDNSTTDVEALLLQSDFALYDAKKAGRGRASTFNRRLHGAYTRETRLAADLKEAVSNGALNFLYQPILNLDGSKVQSLETLACWHHPTEGSINPLEFLPIAEGLGIMADVDVLAMRAAMRAKRQMNDRGLADLHVSFNASSAYLLDPNVLEYLNSALQEFGISSREVALEVRETVAFDIHDQQTREVKVMHKLRKAGFSLLLDDFGSGYAGLTHLAKLSVDGIKVDRSLTQNLLASPASEKILKAVTDLCAQLGLSTTVSGVETQAQSNALASLKIDGVQGFLHSKPLPICQALNWVCDKNHCDHYD